MDGRYASCIASAFTNERYRRSLFVIRASLSTKRDELATERDEVRCVGRSIRVYAR